MSSSSSAILAIDQGTTSSRAILFSQSGTLLKQVNQEFEQLFPQDGWVEHRPEDILSTVPKQSSPASARALAPSTLSKIHAALVALK